MQILLAPAKLMIENPADCPIAGNRTPLFQSEADRIAAAMCDYSVSELSEMLHTNHDLAIATRRRYNDFFEQSTRRAAIGRYDGIVFKKLDAANFSSEQLDYADSHINICSFLYGLLRPLDAVNPYRLEGNVTLPTLGSPTIFDFWKPYLTDEIIRRTNEDDGILVNLASDEMRKLFDWKRVTRELKVISPVFKVESNGRPRTVVVYAKMCRGAMSRQIIVDHITTPDTLSTFSYEGFTHVPSSPSSSPLFLLS